MLTLKNVSYSVEGEKDILKNINLTVNEKEFLVITGPNGGGKSTLAKIVAGILKPQSGEILFNGEDITNLTITERARKGISFAFQQPVRFKGITVRELITMSSKEKLSEHDIREYLKDVGLCAKDYVNREVGADLSGGEIKRIEIATVMARKTPLSIFDEPEAGIDLWSFQNLIKVFKNMRQSYGGSVMIISHQERILDIADKIVVIAEGVVRQEGKKTEILPSLLAKSKNCAFCDKQRSNL